MNSHDQHQPRIPAATHWLWSTFTADFWLPFREAWISRGFWLPPTKPQADMLREIAQARPHDLAAWVSEAPSRGKAAVVVAYVLERWHAAQSQADRDNPLDEDVPTATEAGEALLRLGALLRDALPPFAAAPEPVTVSMPGEVATSDDDLDTGGRDGVDPVLHPPPSQPLSSRPADHLDVAHARGFREGYRLAAAHLRPFLRHGEHCATAKDRGNECTCGLATTVAPGAPQRLTTDEYDEGGT